MQYISNNYFMQEALKEARKAFDYNEIPVGALVVDHTGIIIGKGFNKVEQYKTQSAHAEFEAINQACNTLNNWRLEKCSLIVTLEPCAMCMNLIILSRIPQLIYGASCKIFGWSNDIEAVLQLYKMNKLTITKGILDEEIKRLMKDFFITKRNSHDKAKK